MIYRAWLVAFALMAVTLAGCDRLPIPFPQVHTEEQAIEIARRAAADMLDTDDVLDVRQLTYAEVANDLGEVLEGERPAPADCVWFVNLGSDPGPLMGGGVFVVIDCDTGNLVHVTPWMS